MAIYTGDFIYDPTPRADGNATYYCATGPEGSWSTYQALSMGYGSEPLRYLLADVLRIVDSPAMRAGNWDGWTVGAYNVSVKGVPTPQLPNKILSSQLVKNNNAPYAKRVRNNEIIVSDFQRFGAILTYINGYDIVPKGDPYGANLNLRCLQQDSSFAENGKPVWNCVSNDSGKTSVAGTVTLLYQRQTRTDTATPYSKGWSDDVILRFLNEISVDRDVISSQVMGTLSDANVASVDILTAMAEMPETIVSALKGCKVMLRLFRDAKNKELSFLNKEKRIRTEHEAKVKRLDFDSRDAYLAARNDRTRRRIIREKERAKKQLKLDLKRSLKDVTTAIAGVWMNYRYNINPNVSLVVDVLESLKKTELLFERWRDLESVTIQPPIIDGWTCSGALHAKSRVMIKRGFQMISDDFALLRNFSSNAALTLWEVIPLSFVVDWFVNVGDLLSATLGNNQYDYTQAATISVKVERQTLTYTHNESRAQVKVEISGYRRNVINPDDYCRLQFFPELNWKRYADSAALGWNLAKNSLRSQRKLT